MHYFASSFSKCLLFITSVYYRQLKYWVCTVVTIHLKCDRASVMNIVQDGRMYYTDESWMNNWVKRTIDTGMDQSSSFVCTLSHCVYIDGCRPNPSASLVWSCYIQYRLYPWSDICVLQNLSRSLERLPSWLWDGLIGIPMNECSLVPCVGICRPRES